MHILHLHRHGADVYVNADKIVRFEREPGGGARIIFSNGDFANGGAGLMFDECVDTILVVDESVDTILAAL